MLKKTLAVFAAVAMLLPGSLIKAEPPNLLPKCSFYLKAKNGDKSSGYVHVKVDWDYRTFDLEPQVKPISVVIYNYTGRPITLVTDRWQNSNGSYVEKGVGGNISNNNGSRPWYPLKFIEKSQSPYVEVSAAASTRPGLGGSVKCNDYSK